MTKFSHTIFFSVFAVIILFPMIYLLLLSHNDLFLAISYKDRMGINRHLRKDFSVH